MNSAAILTQSEAAEPATSAPFQPATCNIQPATLERDVVPAALADALPKKRKKREKGKIAELPQEQKDMINRMLDDGKTYKVIELEMAKLGVSLNGENISRSSRHSQSRTY